MRNNHKKSRCAFWLLYSLQYMCSKFISIYAVSLHIFASHGGINGWKLMKSTEKIRNWTFRFAIDRVFIVRRCISVVFFDRICCFFFGCLLSCSVGSFCTNLTSNILSYVLQRTPNSSRQHTFLPPFFLFANVTYVSSSVIQPGIDME